MLEFIQRKNKGITFVEHKGLLNDVANNWKGSKTVKIIGKYMFILDCSINYFIELTVKNKIHLLIKKEL